MSIRSFVSRISPILSLRPKYNLQQQQSQQSQLLLDNHHHNNHANHHTFGFTAAAAAAKMSSQSTRTTTTTATNNNNSTASTSSSDITQSHYETHSAESYDSAYFYEIGPYMKHLRNVCYNRLQLNIRSPPPPTPRDWNGSSTNQPTVTTGTTNTTITNHRILLDIGGGTGTFTRSLIATTPIHENEPPQQFQQQSANELTTSSATSSASSTTLDNNDNDYSIEAIVIDPYLEQHQIINNQNDDNDNVHSNKQPTGRIQFIKAPAEAFMMIDHNDNKNHKDNTPRNSHQEYTLPKQYHQILMKEVVHHFLTKDRIEIFRGMYNYGLLPTTTTTTTTTIIPSILIITRPQYEIDYPLWEAAKTIWAQHQPSTLEITNDLESVGFTNVTVTVETYPCSISMERWKSMIRSRFWSTFIHFTNQELIDATQQIELIEQHRIRDGIIYFEDRLVFISACKV